MDPNLDQRSKWGLIGYLKTKVEGQCDGTIHRTSSRGTGVHPNVRDNLTLHPLSCQQTDTLLFGIKANERLGDAIKFELIETVKESNPSVISIGTQTTEGTGRKSHPLGVDKCQHT